MTNLDIVFKSTDITLLTKVHRVKALVFPVVMYGCESWTIKKAEHRRIDTFELWCWRSDRLPTPVFLAFPGGSSGKESACNVEDHGSSPGLGRSPGEGNSYPLQYSCLENPMDRAAWQAIVHRVTESDRKSVV